MDVRFVPGVSNDDATRLARIGIATVEALREADPGAAGAAADIEIERMGALVEAAKVARILTDIAGLGPEEERKLLAAGVLDPDALNREEPDSLAVRTGLDADAIREWQGRRPVVPTKVVLKGSTASVLHGGEWRAGLVIVTARDALGVDAALASVVGDAVVLVAGSDEAVARLGGEAFESVPLYKERIARAADGGDEIEEIRVRVEEIRERRPPEPPAAEKRGFLSRLRKK